MSPGSRFLGGHPRAGACRPAQAARVAGTGSIGKGHLSRSIPTGMLPARFGADGTPMALPVDASGRIAGPAAAGGEAVLALLGAGEREPAS